MENIGGKLMFNTVWYILPILLLLVRLTVYFVGRPKKNNKILGIGVGIIVCLIVLKLPDFSKGFIEGYANGINF